MDFDAIRIKETPSIQCYQCGKRFCRKKWADKHEKKCKSFIEPVYKCLKCPEKFKTKQKAKEHCLKDSVIYICSECNKTFYSDRALKIHSFADHNIKKTYKCEFCDRLFSYEFCLRKHSIVHSLENRFKCDFCIVLTTFKTQLQLHQHLLKTHFTY